MPVTTTNKYTGTVDGTNVVGIPSDILSVHVNDLLFEAMPVMRYDQFAVVRNDLQAQPGSTIVFSKYGNLPIGGKIDEDKDLLVKSLSKTSVNIVVTEYGNAVGLTSKYLTQAFMDEMQVSSILLGRDYAKVTDVMLRDAVFSGTQTYLAGNVAAQKDITADYTFGLDDVDGAVEVLETTNVLKYADANGEYYVSFIHPHQAKAVRKSMIAVRQYAYPELIFKGEIGEYNGVRFIVTSNVPNGAASSALDEYGNAVDVSYDATLVAGYVYSGTDQNTVNLYKSVIFGQRAYGWAVGLPVELREDPGFQNFGRKKGLAWYAIQGAAKINDENIVVITSA